MLAILKTDIKKSQWGQKVCDILSSHANQRTYHWITVSHCSNHLPPTFTVLVLRIPLIAICALLIERHILRYIFTHNLRHTVSAKINSYIKTGHIVKILSGLILYSTNKTEIDINRANESIQADMKILWHLTNQGLDTRTHTHSTSAILGILLLFVYITFVWQASVCIIIFCTFLCSTLI